MFSKPLKRISDVVLCPPWLFFDAVYLGDVVGYFLARRTGCSEMVRRYHASSIQRLVDVSKCHDTDDPDYHSYYAGYGWAIALPLGCPGRYMEVGTTPNWRPFDSVKT